jgi:glycyl-tRNA synthetase
MEMQYFIKPGTQREAFEMWRETRWTWHLANGIRPENLRWHEHEKLAHYADAASDIEYQFPMGFQEVEGIHSRTDFDLSRHQTFSGKKMEYFDQEAGERYIPYVLETSVGLDRTVLMILCDAYREEEVDGSARTVLGFHPALAPVKAAVFPLVKKDGMPEKARAIVDDLRTTVRAEYDEKGAVGRRYRRQDEIGTPFCITVDGDTLTDDTVTVRERDSMQQTRIASSQVSAFIHDRMAGWTPTREA